MRFQDTSVEGPYLESTESGLRLFDQAGVPTLDTPRAESWSSGQLFVDL